MPTPIHTKISYDPRGFDAVVCVLTDTADGQTQAFRWMLRAYEGQSIPEMTRLALEHGEPMTWHQASTVFGSQDNYVGV